MTGSILIPPIQLHINQPCVMYTWDQEMHHQKSLTRFHPSNLYPNTLDCTQPDPWLNSQDLKEISNNGTSNVEWELGQMIHKFHVMTRITIVMFIHMLMNVSCSMKNVTSKERAIEFVMINLSLMLTMKSNQLLSQKEQQFIFTTCHVSMVKVLKSARPLIV